jgi:hypothetical protein
MVMAGLSNLQLQENTQLRLVSTLKAVIDSEMALVLTQDNQSSPDGIGGKCFLLGSCGRLCGRKPRLPWR